MSRASTEIATERAAPWTGPATASSVTAGGRRRSSARISAVKNGPYSRHPTHRAAQRSLTSDAKTAVRPSPMGQNASSGSSAGVASTSSAVSFSTVAVRPNSGGMC